MFKTEAKKVNEMIYVLEIDMEVQINLNTHAIRM